ncbi:TetR/AcrR family transcriptional regulator [Sphaerothrix gracilis]|uniref:TetR/AcrR family transcriptional regulator n=1 Tax=Sphaerothrix gracilis TaxID=3151835 RepID=UPI0031FDFF6D
MTSQRNSARKRLIQAALQLFAAQGITETTTRQIADMAGVNEVTLFRHFGSKHGLLLAVLEDAKVFEQLQQTLNHQVNQAGSLSQALKSYAGDCLESLAQIPEFVRSLVGEAGQYPPENRQALGYGLRQANRYTQQYLATVLEQKHLDSQIDLEKLASLLNALLFGYAVLEFTSEFHEFWHDREEFVENLTLLFLHGAFSPAAIAPAETQAASAERNLSQQVADLSASLVRLILQRAKKSSPQDYALVYVLFGAGLSPAEIANLQRSHHISNSHQHLLQVTTGTSRQVPINRWIMDHRYGSYTRNPLTQWLKNRKGEQSALFLDDTGNPLLAEAIAQRWQELTADLSTLAGTPPRIEQAQQTWCVEMLMKGMSLENLSILTGQDLPSLKPYARRAREKIALEQAIAIDHKSGSAKNNESSQHLD